MFDRLLKQRTERAYPPGIQMKRYEAKEIRIKMKEGEDEKKREIGHSGAGIALQRVTAGTI